MAQYTDAPPGYDYVVPPRVFAPLPNSGPRLLVGDDRSLFAPERPEWTGSRTNLAMKVPSTSREDIIVPEAARRENRWKSFRGTSKAKSQADKGMMLVLHFGVIELTYHTDNKASWKPVSLKVPFLLGVILISTALVVVLQLLLIKSQRNGGIIFASDVNSLPLRTTFPYLYLPTIIAVIYGFLWNWIDLDVRRIEPFLQLAKEDGATGSESLMLHYPVDFLASVPIKAMRSRHWSVFTASLATVFVFWGITPTQSGIFATDTLNKTIEMPCLRSSSHLSLSQQANTISAKSAQSVTSIMWLNETLQPFMTRDYMLAPFGPARKLNSSYQSGNWTGTTMKYSVDVNCEIPISWVLNGRSMVNSTWGCKFPLPNPRVVSDAGNATKLFDTLYVGYYNDDGLADYYLSDGSCPRSEPSSFLIQWSKTTEPQAFNGTFAPSAEEQRQHAYVTTLYCRSSYSVQEVEATIRLPSNEVLGYRPLGNVEALPLEVFNVSNFEAAMSMGHERFRVRTDFPTTNWPSQTAFLANLPLNLAYLPKMAPFAIGASRLPLDDYLDPINLANSYQSAYRLLFARQMVDVLSRELDMESERNGQLSYETQSIILVPAFTYIVESLLLASIFFAAIILHNSGTRISKLQSDPATIAAVMALAADDSALLNKFKLLDQKSDNELELAIRNRRFRLVPVQGTALSHRLQLVDLRGNEPPETFNDELQAAHRHPARRASKSSNSSKAGIVDGVRPTELKAKLGVVFLIGQILLFSVIAALFATIQKNKGLPLPSSSRFVRQLVENYLPTAIGTFIEPFWVVLNRHLCFLQPFDEMRQGRRTDKKSLRLEYSSLPPQLTIVKAFSNGNLLLGVVCTMALLANGLAISLSGLLFEDSVQFGTPAVFQPEYSYQFNPLNGSAGPFISEDKQSLESVYIATSNRTANTSLPAWTDSQRFYFPFKADAGFMAPSQSYRARTPTISAKLACLPLSKESNFNLTGTQKGTGGQFTVPGSADLVVSLTSDQGEKVECIIRNVVANGNTTFGQPIGASAIEFFYALDGSSKSSAKDASFCREHLAAGWVRATLINGSLPANESSFANQTIITSHEETIAVCQTKLTAASADILVSADGHVQNVYSVNNSIHDVTSFLSTTPSDLIAQVHQIILSNVEGLHWHTDALPSDFLNFLVEQAINSSLHLDPENPPPSFDSIVAPFDALFSQLFATLIGRNMDRLLKPVSTDKSTILNGFTVRVTTRVFMSKAMFIIAEVILILYIGVTITLYLRRPWRILCRMPTSLGSIIAFFAASHAVNDFRGTLGMSSKELNTHMKRSNDRFGFGTFIGTDGKAHIGIEKYPFLAPLTIGSVVTRQDSKDGKRSWRLEWRSKFAQWKSGKVREGGWM
ncbi:hypothetical protein FKW77_010376 [Venturia effusa]|uniref:Uncharacterized protein n=1 Tax=Venturia effusa TaxID=50376 RepID=A0A517L0G5_9PEZI|nr:hypothetical protein FKW77_010376 [Venturia effusa]